MLVNQMKVSLIWYEKNKREEKDDLQKVIWGGGGGDNIGPGKPTGRTGSRVESLDRQAGRVMNGEEDDVVMRGGDRRQQPGLKRCAKHQYASGRYAKRVFEGRGRTRGSGAKHERKMLIQNVKEEGTKTAMKRINYAIEDTNNQILDIMRRKICKRRQYVNEHRNHVIYILSNGRGRSRTERNSPAHV